MALPRTIKAITISQVRLDHFCVNTRVLKARCLSQNGGIEVIEESELPFPTVKPGDVVIKVSRRFLR